MNFIIDFSIYSHLQDPEGSVENRKQTGKARGFQCFLRDLVNINEWQNQV